MDMRYSERKWTGCNWAEDLRARGGSVNDKFIAELVVPEYDDDLLPDEEGKRVQELPDGDIYVMSYDEFAREGSVRYLSDSDDEANH